MAFQSACWRGVGGRSGLTRACGEAPVTAVPFAAAGSSGWAQARPCSARERSRGEGLLGNKDARRASAHGARAQGRPVAALVQPRLDELLDERSERTTPKQRLTATRTHRQLIEEGCDVGITLVRNHLRERHRRDAEVCVPLVHRPGVQRVGARLRRRDAHHGAARPARPHAHILTTSGASYRTRRLATD